MRDIVSSGDAGVFVELEDGFALLIIESSVGGLEASNDADDVILVEFEVVGVMKMLNDDGSAGEAGVGMSVNEVIAVGDMRDSAFFDERGGEVVIEMKDGRSFVLKREPEEEDIESVETLIEMRSHRNRGVKKLRSGENGDIDVVLAVSDERDVEKLKFILEKKRKLSLIGFGELNKLSDMFSGNEVLLVVDVDGEDGSKGVVEFGVKDTRESQDLKRLSDSGHVRSLCGHVRSLWSVCHNIAGKSRNSLSCGNYTTAAGLFTRLPERLH